MAKLDIVEKRIPQDGRAVIFIKNTELDLRTSTLPTIYGEKVVIRILRRNEETLNRRGIGIPAEEDAKIGSPFRAHIRRHHDRRSDRLR